MYEFLDNILSMWYDFPFDSEIKNRIEFYETSLYWRETRILPRLVSE